jgi:hypothetical protein
MDEIGLMVTDVDAKGFLRVSPLGRVFSIAPWAKLVFADAPWAPCHGKVAPKATTRPPGTRSL